MSTAMRITRGDTSDALKVRRRVAAWTMTWTASTNAVSFVTTPTARTRMMRMRTMP